jgi:glycosyltransferase involved in cell wall biosynthesis
MKQERVVQAFFYNNPDNYPPIINGARLLAQAGWQVELYCRDDGRDWNIAYPEAVTIERVKFDGEVSWRTYLSFCREAMRRGKSTASVFIGHDAHGLVPARLLAARYRRPLIYHCYDYADNSYPQTSTTRALKRLQVLCARKAGVVTVPDPGLADLIATDLRLKRQPLVVANSPLTRENRGGSLTEALRQRGCAFEKVVFRQGRIGPGHGIEVTIRSIPHWTNRKWGFVVMGIGDAAYLQSLAEIASSVGVVDQFVVLPPVSYDQVRNFTSDADVGHALYEPIHVNNLNISGACKIQEYMAAEVPLLVSDRPSLRKLLREYDCGLAADDTWPESIAASVNTLLSDSNLASTMGQSGKRAFEEVFCYERQFAPVLAWMEETLARRSPESAAEFAVND